MTVLSAAERETTIRWDREASVVTLYTADPVEARRWTRLGYAVAQVGVGWRAEGPKGCVRIRRVQDGVLVKRKTVPPGRKP